MQKQDQSITQQPEPFRLAFIKPFTTFTDDGKPAAIPFLADGLLREGGLSVLGAKPKQGKSSISRYLAVSVSKGLPFLGRDTTRGEVILVSLEDPRIHTDNHLKVLGYDPETDSQIHITEHLDADPDQTIAALRHALTQMPDVRLVIVDHLAKLLRLKDLSEYMDVLTGIEKLRNLAVEFPRVHILAVAHCKKMKTDDPFDSILGSTAVRGEAETNFALFEEDGQRVIAVETRVGRPFPPSILHADVVDSAGASVVRDFALSGSFEQWQASQSQKTHKKQTLTYEQRVITFMEGCDGSPTLHKDVIANVTGKTERVNDAIKSLEAVGVVIATGAPKVLTLDAKALSIFKLSNLSKGVN